MNTPDQFRDINLRKAFLSVFPSFPNTNFQFYDPEIDKSIQLKGKESLKELICVNLK